MRISRPLSVAAALVVIAAPAHAAGAVPVTVSAGGASSGSAPFTAQSGTINWDTSAGLALTCDSGTGSGSFTLGESPDGVSIGSVDETTYAGCVGWSGIPFDWTQVGTWGVDAVGVPVDEVTPVEISDVVIDVANPDGQCSFRMRGTIDAAFDADTQSLGYAPRANALVVSEVVGCFGLINDDDMIVLTSASTVANPVGPIAITSP